MVQCIKEKRGTGSVLCINKQIKQLFEPRYEKTDFLNILKQRRRSAAQLISAFVFATRIVQSLFFLNPKFQASSHLLWLYSPICVRPGRKPRRPVFSQRGSFNYSVTEENINCIGLHHVIKVS